MWESWGNLRFFTGFVGPPGRWNSAVDSGRQSWKNWRWSSWNLHHSDGLPFLGTQETPALRWVLDHPIDGPWLVTEEVGCLSRMKRWFHSDILIFIWGLKKHPKMALFEERCGWPWDFTKFAPHFPLNRATELRIAGHLLPSGCLRWHQPGEPHWYLGGTTDPSCLGCLNLPKSEVYWGECLTCHGTDKNLKNQECSAWQWQELQGCRSLSCWVAC